MFQSIALINVQCKKSYLTMVLKKIHYCNFLNSSKVSRDFISRDLYLDPNYIIKIFEEGFNCYEGLSEKHLDLFGCRVVTQMFRCIPEGIEKSINCPLRLIF